MPSTYWQDIVLKEARCDIPPECWAELDERMKGTLRYQRAALADAMHDLSLAIVTSPRIRRWLGWR